MLEWAREAEGFGAGELLVTSVDNEGRKRGFDIELIRKVSEAVSIPVIASGGAGELYHIKQIVADGKVSAVAVASMLHYGIASIGEIKAYLALQIEKVAV